MNDFGKNIVPLSVVGMFLNHCGNHVLQYIHTILRRKVFFPSHRVTSIQLLQNGEVLTTAMKRHTTIKKSADGSHLILREQETQVTFRSKGIVVSNGGK